MGGNWNPEGTRLAIRTYTEIWEWETDPMDPEAHWGDAPTIWQAPVEAQGEAVAYMKHGPLVTTSEGTPMPVNIMLCAE